MHPASSPAESSPVRKAYERLRAGFRVAPFPSLEERQDRLKRLADLVRRHQEAFLVAIDADFGGRSRHDSLMADVLVTLDAVRFAQAHVAQWMQRQPVRPAWFFLPSTSYIEYLPRGVVAIISPWNYPVNLALAPLAGALAAGNRVLLKPSELTPRTSEVLARAVRDFFSAEEVAVVEGNAEVAKEVTQLPVDHLFFTGSTVVGRMVARAAAENLTSLTLELGGKSPALVQADYPIEKAAERIAVGKLFNGGQSCVAPDYALISERQVPAFAEAFRAAVRNLYPDLASNPDYCSIASVKGYERLKALLADAEAKGARIERLLEVPAQLGSRRFPPTLVFAPSDQMRLMQEEIFGPILPIVPYRSIDEALEFVSDRPHPLAFYYFDTDPKRVNSVLQRTVSGGVCVNDTMLQFAQEGLPFGGVGESGLGAYHGLTGFKTFSHARGVFLASPLSPVGDVQAPPYGKLIDRALAFLLR